MYDFANSGYTTVVITAVFNAYFVAEIAQNATWATFAWTCALAISYAAIVVTAPLIGAYADAHAAKKRLLFMSMVGCVVFTAALAYAGTGELWIAIVLLVLSNFFFGTGENLIAAFLPELADEQAMGRVSGWGWSLGYCGGLLALGLCLAYVTWAQARGLPATHFVPVTMVITAVFFAVASAPTFLFLRERARPAVAGRHVLSQAITRLQGTLHEAAHYRDFGRFLIAVVFYQAGIQAVVALAAIYAQQVMEFTTQDTLALILVVNVTAAIGAFLFGYAQDRYGHVPTLVATLIGWIIAVVLAFLAEDATLFWVAANVVGLCLGSSQSAARGLVGYLAPPDRTAEFFGLWGLAVKLSAVLGPITYGSVTWISGGNHRLAILLTGTYFAVGLAIVAAVDVARGRKAALAAVQRAP
jgi:MFS transporter, UMF1 family